MAGAKIKNNIFVILFDTLKIYFSNIDTFFLYMIFPVLGQIAGIILSLGLSIGLAPLVADKISNPLTAIAIVIVLALPGILIFCKAFWDYMVAYIAICSMTEAEISIEKIYDIPAHNAVATQHAGKFILLLILIGLFNTIASSIFFIIPAFIVWIYFILIFQVYTFEQDLSITEMLKKSFNLIKGSWLKTTILMLILAFTTIYIVTQGVTVVLDYLRLTDKIYSLCPDLTIYIPHLKMINQMLSKLNLPILTNNLIIQNILYSFLTFIVMGFTLPIRSIAWTLWYFSLSNNNKKSNKKNSRKTDEDEDYE